MVVFAAIEFAGLLALIVGVLGLSGIIFSALKFNRDDTTAIVQQQNLVLNDMKIINDELRTTTEVLRTERNELKIQVTRLSEEVQALRHEMSDG